MSVKRAGLLLGSGPVGTQRGLWPAWGLRRLYCIRMGEELERAEPLSYEGSSQEGVQRPWWGRVFGT